MNSGMSDSFKQDSERIGKLIVQLKGDINKREIKKNEGKMTGMVDAEIRGSLNQLDTELDNISKLINQYQNDPKQFNLLVREIERRRNVFQDYVNQRNELKKRVENQSFQQQQQQLFNQKQENRPTFEQQYGGQDKKSLFQVQKQLQQNQNDQLEQINQKVLGIKYIGLGINDNIRQQNKHLDSLNDDVDKTTSMMNKTKNKMSKFVQSSSSCGLLSCIVLEVIALILILVLL